jgi:DNA-binding MarR family transcriptional regulator
MSDSRSKQSLRLWLRMLSCTALIEKKLSARLRDAFEITLPQFEILAELERAGNLLTMSELSRQLMVSNGNVTGVVTRLESYGLVQRINNTTDRRVFHIKLTPKGQKSFAVMAQQHETWVNEMLHDLPTAQITELDNLLSHAKQSVKTSDNKTPQREVNR